MSSTTEKYRWRKVTDINREFAIFELITDEKLLLDVGFSDEGIFEIAFASEVANLLISWDFFKSVIEEGRKMAELDRL